MYCRLANSLTSTIGLGERRSDQTSTGSETAAAMVKIRTGVEVKPSLPPWLTTSSSDPMVLNSAVAPIGSRWNRPPAVRSSGRTHQASAAPAAAIGTLV